MCEPAVMKQAPESVGKAVAQCTTPTGVHHARLSTPLVALLVLFMGMSGCVPVPYRPAATASHVPVGTAVSSIVVSSSSKLAMAGSLAEEIHKMDPRIVVETQPDVATVFSHGPELMQMIEPAHAAELAALPADYLLTIGPKVHRQLHDTGAAAPFVYFPVVWVGYEKVQSVDTLCASFVDLHAPQTVDEILVASPYTEVIAAMVYGVGTIAMTDTPMRRALAEDVAHALAAAHPTGEIRLMILTQEGGDEVGTHVCTPEPRKTVSAHNNSGIAKSSATVAAAATTQQP
jgi:hypothetical protein